MAHDDVEQVAGVLAVHRGYRKRVAGAESVELVVVGARGIVDLVGDEQPRLLRVAQQIEDAGIARMQSDFGVDDHQQQIGLANRLDDLAPDLEVHRNVRIVGQPAGIHQPELPAVPVRAREMAIARGARLVADDRAVIADDAVEKGRLADVRPADDCNYRDIHAATASASAARKSTKSYEGKTGIGSDARSVSKSTSSRKMPSSLIVSAGISASERS